MTLIKYRNDLRDYTPVTFNSLLDTFFNENFNNINEKNRTFNPKVDIVETEKGFEVSLAAPGLKKEDFNVEVTDGYLTVSGERKWEENQEGRNYVARETQYGSFSKSYKLPKHVNAEKIEAKYDAGILSLFIPKEEQKVLKNTIKVK